MKVKELIKELIKYDQGSIVVLSSDEGGNSFSTVRGIKECLYDITENCTVDIDKFDEDDNAEEIVNSIIL